jgi:amino acid transporter
MTGVSSAQRTAPAAEERDGFHRALGWRDGFALALSIPVGGFTLIGYSIGALGAWTAMTLWAVSCLVALLQNFIFAELAAMFPNKPGGIALYAHEGWRRYCSPVGPLAAVGYWAGWSFGLAVYSLLIGDLLQAQFFPHSTWTVSDGPVQLGLGNVIAVAAIVAVWLLNVFGVRPAVRINKLLGGIACVAIVVLLIGSFVTGHWHASTLSWGGLGQASQPWHGWQLALVYLYVMGWTAYATEIGATFTPEYRDRKRDTPRVLISSALLTLVFLVVGVVSTTGVVGEKAVTADPVGYLSTAFQKVVGGGAWVMTLVVVAAIFVNMTSATADAGRALYGIAKDDMIIKQFNYLNKERMPSRAMTLDLFVNIALVLFVGNIVGVLFASNLGYMLATVFALTGFLLLRRDRPDWPRPIKRSRIWIPIAWVLVAFNVVLIVLGVRYSSIAGYGGVKDALIGTAVLATSLVLFAYRRLVQDRGRLRLRERDDAAPVQTVPST